MKRMYVVLSIIIAVVFWAGTLLGQRNSRPVDDQTSDHLERALKMREEMHRRMMDKFFNGNGPDQDMFSDMESMMEEMMKDSFTGFNRLSGVTSYRSFKMEWAESSTGRTLVITPNDPKQNLDINVANGMITIKGKEETKSQSGVSVSKFSSSVNVPDDCDPAKVKMEQKDSKIHMHFPYRTAAKTVTKPKDERRPIPPSKDDIEI